MKYTIIFFIAILMSGCASLIKQKEPEIITKIEYVSKECVISYPDKLSFKDVDWGVLVQLNLRNSDVFNPFYDFVDGYNERYDSVNNERYLEKDGLEYLIYNYWIYLYSKDDYSDLSHNMAELKRYIKQADLIIEKCKGASDGKRINNG